MELEKRIAEEENKWKADKELLLTSRDVLLTERKALQAKSEANELAFNLFRRQLENARTDIGDHEQARILLSEAFNDLETRIRSIATQLPPPLAEKIDPLLELLEPGTEEEPTPVSQRTQALTGILTSIDQFNNTLTLTHELRQDESGETRDVKVLYWGLAAGYAVESSGDDAWLLTPSADGWVWNEAGGDLSNIRALVNVYEKEQSPKLVVLPIKAKGVLP